MVQKEQTRRSRKRDNTHKALMHSAKILFEQNGIGNVTIDRISDAADLSRSTFFSHFASLDDLLKEIANEEIDDMFNAVQNSETEPSISALLKQLNDDSYPYPSLVCELLMRGILSKGESSFEKVDEFVCNEIEKKGGYERARKVFSSKDLSALIFGAYFGLIFQKCINNEPFENPAETNDTIQKFIQFLENKED